jgi:hypothetical protein
MKMSRFALAGLFVACCGVGLVAQAPKVPHVAEVGSAKDKKDVNDTMDMMLKAYKAKDMATLDKIFHKDLVYGHTSGETQDKAKVLAVAKERDTVDSTLTNRMTYVSGPIAMIRGTGNLTLKGEEAGNGRGHVWFLVRDANAPHGWQIVGRQNWPLGNLQP